MVEAARLSREILRASAFDSVRGEEIFPGDAVRSDAEIADFVRRKAETVYHPVGTCRMGIDDDAVVDPQLRVHGVGGLRVVDASIMPTIASGNTNAPTIMIAEKAAAMILLAGTRKGSAAFRISLAGRNCSSVMHVLTYRSRTSVEGSVMCNHTSRRS